MDDMLNVPTFTNDKDDLKIMKTASLNKKSGTISGKKKLSRKEVLRRIKYASSVVLVSAGINMAGNMISETADNLTLRYAENDFWDEAIEPNTHKTDDGQHFYPARPRRNGFTAVGAIFCTGSSTNGSTSRISTAAICCTTSRKTPFASSIRRG